MEINLKESSRSRAGRDTEKFRKDSPIWFWAVEIVGATLFGFGGGYGGFLLIPERATATINFVYPAAGSAVGIVAGLILVWVAIYAWNLFRAPYRQRNEARKQLEKLKLNLGQIGYIEALMWDATEIRNRLKNQKPYLFDAHDLSVYKEWFNSSAKYLSKNIPEESSIWYHDVDIPNNAPTLEEVLNSLESGYNVLKGIQRRLLNQNVIR